MRAVVVVVMAALGLCLAAPVDRVNSPLYEKVRMDVYS